MKIKFFLAKFFSSLFYIGFIKKAPGTFGSIGAVILIYPFLQNITFYEQQYILFATLFLGTIASAHYMEITKKMDPKEIVIDEVLGVWLCIFINQYFAPEMQLEILVVASLVLFRFFDILKPFPINIIDSKMKNALGVMLDDVLAGIFASIVFVLAIKVLL